MQSPSLSGRRAASRTLGLVTALGAMVLLNACAGGGGGTTRIQNAENVAPGQSVVVGRILAVEKNRTLKWGSENSDGSFQVLILRKGETTARSHRLRRDGSFAWALEPGEYALAGYHWSRYSRRRSDRVWMEFDVPPGSEAVYIGTVRIDATSIPAVAAVRDDGAAARATLKKHAPRFQGKITKKLMRPEKLSKRVQTRRAICDASWSVPCENNYNGVVSTAPNTAKRTTPTVADLRPTLRWEPAATGVQYDVVVYEAMNHSGGRKLHGRVFDYAEGLTKPEYRLARALKPKSTYYWTVRLRRGETVSNWTRYSYTSYYGIRISRRLNNLYSFDTAGQPVATR